MHILQNGDAKRNDNNNNEKKNSSCLLKRKEEKWGKSHYVLRIYPVSHYQCLYSGYLFGLCIVACSGCGGIDCGGGTGALTILVGSSLVELLGDG